MPINITKESYLKQKEPWRALVSHSISNGHGNISTMNRLLHTEVEKHGLLLIIFTCWLPGQSEGSGGTCCTRCPSTSIESSIYHFLAFTEVWFRKAADGNLHGLTVSQMCVEQRGFFRLVFGLEMT